MPSYDFDIPFQRNLLAAFLADDKALAQGPEYAKPLWFTDEVLGAVAEAAYKFYEREHKRPDLAALKEEVKSHVHPGRKYQEYADEASKVWRRIGTNPEFYRSRACDFARHQALVEALGEATTLVQRGDFEGVESCVRRALRVGRSESEGGLDYSSGFNERAARYLEPNNDANSARRVASGIGPLDRATLGGLGPGEVAVVLGLAGHGKSTVLRQIGANCLLAGRNVLHISLENSQYITAQMYDCLLYGKPIAKIKKRPEKFQAAMTALLAGLKSRLTIQYFPSKTLSLPQLEVEVESARVRPEIVLVDYAVLLRPTKAREERRFDYAEIFENLRGVAARTQVPLWTAHQANRPGMGSSRLGMEHFAECFEIPGIIDLGVSINADESKQAEAELYVFKNRLGPSDFEIPCSVDWTTSRIRAFMDEEVTSEQQAP
jgi:replicative DNA helicase